MSEHDAEAWLARTKALLDQSAEGLDAATLSRLNRARQVALETRVQRRPFWMLPAALASAMALVVAVALWRPYTQAPEWVGPTVAAEDFELLAGEDGLELYADLEFYAWLDTQEAGG